MHRILTTALFLFFSLSIHGQQDFDKQINSKIRSSIAELKSFVSIPNDAINFEDIDRNIVWLENAFEKRGFDTSRLSSENLDVLYASKQLNERLPTLLFYMHLDGQSVDGSKWDQSDPYEMVIKKPINGGYTPIPYKNLEKEVQEDWRLFGRSTSDDKGPIVMFLQSIDLIGENQIDLPYNIKVILDPEEERGSVPLAKVVENNRDLLEADYLIISDGPAHRSGKPTIIFGCRGITTMTLTTYGPKFSQHSGHYGNFAPNPILDLSQLLSSMKDTDGRVLIDGYYDGIKIDEVTKSILKAVPDNDEKIKQQLKINRVDLVGNFYQESLQYPSLNIRGINAGWVGKEARTIVPSHATAELDLRLVPESDGNQLKKCVKNHIENKGYKIIYSEPSDEQRLNYPRLIKIGERGVTDAFRTPLNDPFGEHLKSVLENQFKQEVVRIRIMGGTVPIASFINTLDIPAFIVPMVNHDNNQHSPNENLKIGQLTYGVTAFYKILTIPFSKQ